MSETSPLSAFSIQPSEFSWLSIPAASALSGKSERHLRRLCGEQWLSEGKARLVRPDGLKQQWEIRSDADPALTRTAGILPAVTPAIDADQFRQLPQSARAIAMARAVLLDDWRRDLSRGEIMKLSRDAATDTFLQSATQAAKTSPRPIAIPGRSTLYEWASRQKEEGLLGLVPGYAKRTQAIVVAKDADPFLECLKRHYLDQRKKSIRTCHELAMHDAGVNNWEYRSYAMSKRFLRSLDPATVTLLRLGENAYENKHEPFLNGTYEPLGTNEFWNADHHRFDVVVQVGKRLNAKTGEEEPVYDRPWISAWQDMRSRKIVGHVIRASDPNTDAIVEALDVAFETYELVPQFAYTDNGKDFDSWDLTGSTKWSRRKLKVRHDQGKLGGLYQSFEIDHVRAWKYHGQSKPIERFFGRMEDQFGRLWDTYCGNCPENRPEDLPDQLAKGRAPTLEEFSQAFSAWLETSYHAEAHRGEGMDGKCPNQVYEENIRIRRVVQHEVRRVLLQKRIGRLKEGVLEPLTIGQNGVVHRGIWYGQYELAQYFGLKVFLRIDRKDISRAFVYDAKDDRFIAVASSNLKVARNSSDQDLSAAIEKKRHARKVQRQAARERYRLYQPIPDLMLDAKRQQRLLDAPRQPDPDTTPAPMQVIRSDLEAQLPAIRQANEQIHRRAVGDGVNPEENAVQFHYQSKQALSGGEEAPGSFTYHGWSTEDSHE